MIVECFELCEISSRTQCSCCSQYWAEGIHRLLHLWDLFDSHRIHKISTHYPSPYFNWQKEIAPWCSLWENWTASIAKRRIAVRKGYSSIGYIYIDGENLKKLLDGPKTPADIWTGSRMRITLTLPRGTSGNGTKTTGSLTKCTRQECTRDRERRLLRSCQGNQRLFVIKTNKKVIIQFYRAIRLAKDQLKKGNGNGAPGPHRPRRRQNGKGRERGGPLKSGRTINDFSYKEFRLQEMAISLSAPGGVNSTPHRARKTHTQTFSRVWLKDLTRVQGHIVAACCCLFLKQSSSRAPVMSHTWRDRAPFPLPHSTPSQIDPPDKTNPCAPQPGLLFGRVAQQRPLTSYEPNAPVDVSSTEVTTTLLPSRKASIGSTCNSGEDIVTAPAVSELGERSDLGMLASPLSIQERQAQPYSEFITRMEKVLGHVHHTFPDKRK